MTWPTVPLLEAVEDVSRLGGKIPQSEYLPNGRIPVVDQGQAAVGGYTDDDGAIHRSELPVIVFGDHTKLFKFVDYPFAMGADGVKVFRARAGWDPKYLFHVLRSIYLPDVGYSRHFKFLRELALSRPPLEEQRRIAALLGLSADISTAIRRRVDVAERLVMSLVQSVAGAHPRKLGDVASIATGATPSRRDAGNYGGAIPWVKTTEVRGRRITATEESVTTAGIAAGRLKVFPVGSLVLAMYGQGATRGRVSQLGVEAAVNQACAVIQCGPELEAEYAYWALHTSYEAIRSSGRGGTQPNLNLELVRDIPIALPGLAEQRSLLERVRVLESLIERSHQELAVHKSLSSSLQARAFNGGL